MENFTAVNGKKYKVEIIQGETEITVSISTLENRRVSSGSVSYEVMTNANKGGWSMSSKSLKAFLIEDFNRQISDGTLKLLGVVD